MDGIIYFIQPSEYISTNIYKIGYSRQRLLNRINQYGKETSIISIFRVSNVIQVEKILISEFNSNFTKFKGNEYFICDDIEIATRIFIDVCNSHKMCSNLSVKNENENENESNSNDIKEIRLKTKCNENSKFVCVLCNYKTNKKFNLECHKKTKNHKLKSKSNDIINDKEDNNDTKYSNYTTHKGISMTNNKIDNEKECNKYSCSFCKFSTYKYFNYTKHLNTNKHKMKSQLEKNKTTGLNITQEVFYGLMEENRVLLQRTRQLVKVIENGSCDTTSNINSNIKH